MSGQIFLFVCLFGKIEGIIMCAKALVKYLYGKVIAWTYDQVH